MKTQESFPERKKEHECTGRSCRESTRVAEGIQALLRSHDSAANVSERVRELPRAYNSAGKLPRAYESCRISNSVYTELQTKCKTTSAVDWFGARVVFFLPLLYGYSDPQGKFHSLANLGRVLIDLIEKIKFIVKWSRSSKQFEFGHFPLLFLEKTTGQ